MVDLYFNLLDFFIDLFDFLIGEVHFVFLQLGLLFGDDLLELFFQFDNFFDIVNKNDFGDFEDIAGNSIVRKEFFKFVLSYYIKLNCVVGLLSNRYIFDLDRVVTRCQLAFIDFNVDFSLRFPEKYKRNHVHDYNKKG
jgi:hypothetical protein